MECPRCKKEVYSLFPLGNYKFCSDCDSLIRKKILTRINPNYQISYLEQEMIINLFLEMDIINADIIFQFEIFDNYETKEVCALERWAENNQEKFNCPSEHSHFENCNNFRCKFYKHSKTIQYLKYILDFAILKDGKKIDLELDGLAYHKNKEYDSKRNDFMEKNGWIVLRYNYQECMYKKEKIIKDIIENLK